MATEKFTQFDYLLNSMLHAGDKPRPADYGYGEKRRKLYEHVRELERKAAAYDALTTSDEPSPAANTKEGRRG